jgi:CheY-like chemotaxis protein
VIGDNDSLFELKKIIPNDIITKTFLRPIDVNDLIRSLDKADNVVFKLTDKKNILIVDDNATVLRKMKSVLETRYHCYIASSGMDAIKIITKNKIDLVLLDYEMPEVNGIQVLKMIRSDEAIADTPVMFLSGKCDKDVVVSAVALKPEKYLLKSMSSIELVKSIEQFFIDRQLEELGN